MSFSDWQLNRLRDCLRAYHTYGRSWQGDGYTWNDLAEAIAEDTGVAIESERLRQFVMGIRTEDGGRKYPTLKDASLDAVVKFATDPDNHLISADELREPRPEYHAALRLLEYLDPANETRLVPPASLCGTYQRLTTDEHGLLVLEMTLQRPTEIGLIQTVLIAQTYDHDAAFEIAGLPLHERKRHMNSEVQHSGWAILTPEDTLLFFLKNDRNGRNIYYFTIASDFDLWENKDVERLIVLRHDYPLDAVKDNNPEGESHDFIVSQIQQNILFFKRNLLVV